MKDVLAIVKGTHLFSTRRFRHITDPLLRPPIYEEMQEDIRKVIANIAGTYTDHGCPQLNYDDLVAEGNLKLAELHDKGYIDRLPRNDFPSRAEWFKFFKTSVNNHIRGLVHRHRGTIKRTGIKLPPKEVRNRPEYVGMSTKPIELSIDDPESGLQLGESAGAGDDIHSALEEELRVRLSPVDQLVLDQLNCPNDAANLYAVLDALEHDKLVNLKIKTSHLAHGIGLTEEQFLTAQKRIKHITLNVMSELNSSDDNSYYNSCVAALSKTFNVQVPPAIIMSEPATVSRLFTMLARQYADKLTPELNEMLSAVKAAIPNLNSKSITPCFGVLYSQCNHLCHTCGVKEACALKAAETGIDGTIVYNARVLTSRSSQRIPTLKPITPPAQVEEAPELAAETPEPEAAPEPVAETQVESLEAEEVLSQLGELLSCATCKGSRYYQHRDSAVRRYIFCASPGKKLQLRFCNPSEDLKQQLEKIKNGFYLPENIEISEAMSLIKRHCEETL